MTHHDAAMKYLTWPGGVVMMLLAWGTSLYTLYQLVNMHELDGAALTYDMLAGMRLLCLSGCQERTYRQGAEALALNVHWGLCLDRRSYFFARPSAHAQC